MNSGIGTTLASNKQSLESFIKSKGYKIPSSDDKKKDKVYQETIKKYSDLNAKLDDAFLDATIDEVYNRELIYQLSVVKQSINRRKKATSGKTKELYEKMDSNFENAIKQLESISSNTNE